MVRTLKVAGHYACRNYDDLLEKGHTFLFLRVRNIRMITMLGMMKWSALNIMRHRPEMISPEILLVWSFSRSQLSAKIAVNMAVSTKSNPLVVVCLVYAWFISLLVYAWFILQVSVVKLLQKCCKFEFFY